MKMPWDRPELDGWSICGCNHYNAHGRRHLFVSMTKNGRAIVAEGAYEPEVFESLAAQAINADLKDEIPDA